MALTLYSIARGRTGFVTPRSLVRATLALGVAVCMHQTMLLSKKAAVATTGRRLAPVAAAFRPTPAVRRQAGAPRGAAAAALPWQWPPQWPSMLWQQSVIADVRMVPEPCRAGAPAGESSGMDPQNSAPSSAPEHSSSSFSSVDSGVSHSSVSSISSAANGPVTRQRLREIHEQHKHPAGFRRLRVLGDGSCMFRSVVQGDALLRTGAILDAPAEYEAAQRLRGDVVNKLQESRSDIEPFIPGIVDGLESFEGYLQRMARPGTWGGEPELAMASQVLGRPIAVYSPSGPVPQHIITYGEESLKGEPPMHVLWSGNHYDLLVPTGPRSKL